MAMSTTTVVSPVNVEARRGIDLKAGDTVRVHTKIQEKGKTRIQIFEGLVIARKHGAEAGATFTVRRVGDVYGTEKIFPLFSPTIERIEVTGRSQVRRAKLYHIREKATREIKRQMRNRLAVPDEIDETVREDLTQIEGIGPQIQDVLYAGGITTYAALADAKDENVQKMISEVKGQHDATTWNDQAVLARDGKWDELKELQDKLQGGKEVEETKTEETTSDADTDTTTKENSPEKE